MGNRDRVCQWFGFTEWGFRERLDERPTWEPSSGGERRRPATGEMGGRVFQAEGTAAGKSPRPEARVAGVEGMRGEDRLGAEGNGSGGHLEALHFGSEWHGMCWEVFEQGRHETLVFTKELFDCYVEMDCKERATQTRGHEPGGPRVPRQWIMAAWTGGRQQRGWPAGLGVWIFFKEQPTGLTNGQAVRLKTTSLVPHAVPPSQDAWDVRPLGLRAHRVPSIASLLQLPPLSSPAGTAHPPEPAAGLPWGALCLPSRTSRPAHLARPAPFREGGGHAHRRGRVGLGSGPSFCWVRFT